MDITYTPPTMHVSRTHDPPRGRRRASYLARITWCATVRGPRVDFESKAPSIQALLMAAPLPTDSANRWRLSRDAWGDRTHSDGLRTYVTYERTYHRKEEVPESDEMAVASLDAAIGKDARLAIPAQLAGIVDAYIAAEQADTTRRLEIRQANRLAGHLARKADSAARTRIRFGERLEALLAELVKARADDLDHDIARVRSEAEADGSLVARNGDGSHEIISARAVEAACTHAAKFFPAPMPGESIFAQTPSVELDAAS